MCILSRFKWGGWFVWWSQYARKAVSTAHREDDRCQACPQCRGEKQNAATTTFEHQQWCECNSIQFCGKTYIHQTSYCLVGIAVIHPVTEFSPKRPILYSQLNTVVRKTGRTSGLEKISLYYLQSTKSIIAFNCKKKYNWYVSSGIVFGICLRVPLHTAASHQGMWPAPFPDWIFWSVSRKRMMLKLV